MNKNMMIVMGGAVLVAVLVVMLVQLMMGGQKNSSALEDKVQILVADKDLGLGREIKPGDVRWQAWPKDSVFVGAILQEKKDQKPEAAIKGRLARNMAKGEPMMQTALLGKAKGNIVAASLEDGMRAIAIGVSASGMAGGFVGPGDYVDVILTYKTTVTPDADPRIQRMVALNLDKLATETILQNVKVLAIDQTAERAEDGKIKVGKTVTLAVSVEDSERLSLAAQIGTLTLVLRGVGDKAIVQKKWETISDKRLTSMVDEIYAESDKIKKEGGVTNVVRIYDGGEVTALPAH